MHAVQVSQGKTRPESSMNRVGLASFCVSVGMSMV
jgi:hypothetical protein